MRHVGYKMLATKFGRLNPDRFNASFNERAVFYFLAFLAVVVRLRNLDSPITGSYTFRTTQTAWGIRSVANGALSPFSVETPVLGPPWKIPFEFPLYQMFAGFLSRFSGLSVEASGRLVSITFFVLSGFVLYRICRMFFSAGVSLFVYAIFLFNSHNLEYGSSVLIEYCAVFFSLTGFYFALRYCQAFLRKHLTLFFIFGSIAALVKITTALIWIAFGACFALFIYRAKLRSVITLLSVALATLVPAVLWTQWADDQKSKTIYTEWLTSENLRSWNFGTLGQRFNYSDWHRTINNEFFPSVLGSSLITFSLIIISLSFARNRKVAITFISILLLGPLVFTNLYFVHDYYWTAVLPALLFSIAPAIELITDWSRKLSTSASSRSSQTILSLLCGIALIVASWFSFYGTRHFDVFTKSGSIAYNGDEYLVAVKEIQSLTKKDDKVIVIGSDWDPRILYFSDRKGLMIVDKWDPITIIPNSDFGTEYKYVYVYPAAAYDLTTVLNIFRGVSITQVGIGLFEIHAVSS
jgi:hypothetical protein